MPIVSDLAAYVNEHTSLDFAVRTVLFGAPLGTMAFTTRVESHAELFEATAGLNTDNAFQDLVERVSPFLAGPPQDQLREVIHGAPAQSSVGQVSQVVTATVAAGKIAAAMAYGVGITDHVTSTTKASIAFCRNLYGPFGGVSWISAVADMAAADAAAASLAADASYVEALDKAGDLFEPGSATVALSQRII
jgi:hypothetical protein